MEGIEHIQELSKQIQVSGVLSAVVVMLVLIAAFVFIKKMVNEVKSSDQSNAQAMIKILKEVQEEKAVFMSERISNLNLQIEGLKQDIISLKSEIENLKDEKNILQTHLNNRDNQISECLGQKEYFRGKLNQMEQVFEKLNVKVA